MVCLVCAQPLSPTQGRCPRCGFPLLRVPGSVRGRSGPWETLVSAYRRKLLQGIALHISSYTWRQAGDRLVPGGRKEIPLPPLDRLGQGEVAWLEQPFARVSVCRPITLEFVLRRDSGGYRLLRLQFPPPQAADFWQVGVGLDSGLRAKAYLRCATEIYASEPFPLLTD